MANDEKIVGVTGDSTATAITAPAAPSSAHAYRPSPPPPPPLPNAFKGSVLYAREGRKDAQGRRPAMTPKESPAAAATAWRAAQKGTTCLVGIGGG